MKFSILLPTRNRLDLLKLAVESVRMQDHADWEIVISDNASDIDIGAQVCDPEDQRIRSRRIDHLVPVTDNWNAALEIATGDYVIMLGDDDVLVSGGLKRMEELIRAWHCPDAIYAQAHQYAYPNVMPGHAKPFMQTGYNAFLQGSHEAFKLETEVAHGMVRAAMGFRILYGFNMQHFVFSRQLVERLKPKGPFFQSPYPDYYAANAVLLAAESLVATPDCVALIGISPKSFGFYHVNGQENAGVAFLHNGAATEIFARLRDELVPGSNMNDSWLYAMETLKRNFPEARGRVSYSRYRRLQYHTILKAHGCERYRDLLRYMRLWEIAVYGLVAAAYVVARILPGRMSRHVRDLLTFSLFSRSPRFDPNIRVVPYQDILEAARAHAH